MADLLELFNNKVVIAICSSVLTVLVTYFRNRVKTLQYRVHHERVAFSSNDPIMGSIQVAWQNTNVTNLFTSRIELKNDTNRDFVNISFKIYTGHTVLLTERTEVLGTTQIIPWSLSFKQQLAVPAGSTPTQTQFDVYNSSREYELPVFNRGQVAVMTYLTTVPNVSAGPSVWLDLVHQGVKVEYVPTVLEIHGVSQKVALVLGLVLSLICVLACILYVEAVWLAVLIAILVGLFAQSIGAYCFKAFKLIKSIYFS